MDTLPSLVQSSLHAFGSLVSLLESNDPVRAATAQSHLARFKLWVGSLGAHHTLASGLRSLVYRLRDASTIRSHVVSLLEDLKNSLGEAISLVQSPGSTVRKQENDYVDNELAYLLGETENFASYGLVHDVDLARLLVQMGDVIDCLLRLSVTIRNPAPYDQFKFRVDVRTSQYEPYDINHVREKFPKLDRIVSIRLGRALTQRRQYFKYRENQHQRLQEDSEIGAKTYPKGEEGRTAVASPISQHLGDSTKVNLTVLDVAPSETSVTSYARSIDMDASEIRVPPLPKEHVDGPFQCPFCFTVISAHTRDDWKKHVFEDLRPYVCTWNTCMSLGQHFQERKDWVRHMVEEHWRHWDCPLGCSMTLKDSRTLEAHMKAQHAEDLDTQRASEILIRSTHIDIDKVRGECPLCWDFEIKSVRQYAEHIGHHLEQLALFTLPNTAESEESPGDYEEQGIQTRGDKKGKRNDLKHSHRMRNSQERDHDNGNETTAHIKMHTGGVSSEPHSSIHYSPEIRVATSQIGDHSELGAKHFTQHTKPRTPGSDSKNDAEQDGPGSNGDLEEGMDPQRAKIRQTPDPGKGQPRNFDLPVRGRPSTSADVVTRRQPRQKSHHRSSLSSHAESSQSDRRIKPVQEKKEKKWFCAWCNFGPLDWIHDTSCIDCERPRDQYCRIEYGTGYRNRVT